MLSDIVPNKFPAKVAARRIAIVAEAAGTSERAWTTCTACRHEFASEYRDVHGFHKLDYCPQCFKRDGLLLTPKPLVGPSGWLLDKLLAGAGIERAACFVGNVCMRQPPGNDISRFKWDGEEITTGLLQLSIDLVTYQPHFCLLLGGTPLRAFKGPGKWPISDWRGSLFMAEFGGLHVKCMATFHPAALLREAGLTGVARFDFKRLAEESRSDELTVVPRKITVCMPDGKEFDKFIKLEQTQPV